MALSTHLRANFQGAMMLETQRWPHSRRSLAEEHRSANPDQIAPSAAKFLCPECEQQLVVKSAGWLLAMLPQLASVSMLGRPRVYQARKRNPNLNF